MKRYFSHDSNARNNEKILKVRQAFGMEGYGIYFAIIEKLREEKDCTLSKDYDVIAFDFRVEPEAVKSIVEDFDLFVFTEDGEYFYSPSLKDDMDKKAFISKIRAELGRKGGLKKSENLAKAKQRVSNSQAIANKNRSNSLAIATKNCSNSQENTKQLLSKPVAIAKQKLSNCQTFAKTQKEEKEESEEKEKQKKSNTKENIREKEEKEEKEEKIVLPDGPEKLSDDNFLFPVRTREKKPALTQRARLLFEDFYASQYGEKPYIDGKEMRYIKSLLQKISYSRQNRGDPLPVDDDSLVEAFEQFLANIDKSWILNNFSPTMIATHYNEIVSEIKNRKNEENSRRQADRRPTIVTEDFKRLDYDKQF